MTNSPADGRPTDSRADVFRALADESRREVLRLAYERSPDGIGKNDLALEVAAVTNDKPVDAVSDDDHDRALIDCTHRLLPALRDADLVTVDDGTVTTTDHWAYDDPEIVEIVSGRTDASSDELDAAFHALAEPRRLAALSALSDANRPLTTAELARAVAAREAATTERDVTQDRIDRVHTSLVHGHLSTLSDVGLLEYEADSDRVSTSEERIVCTTWIDGNEDDDAKPRVYGVDVRTADDCETLISVGQSV
ncbi:DUF7344 domain-containing protein [Natronobacterium texcoconense]|uniref:DUF7344 domain-containing protein n=1 Tax=Natronobacterium texcoconense TaxID=1095778 RepID=A0A1H1IX02_NATTX|nr:hypothetical protein [Natronobacterium texcoconense]SDR41896.1 hypothetical protein SAMN04489842_3840 [Natronobacterium texcoconense]